MAYHLLAQKEHHCHTLQYAHNSIPMILSLIINKPCYRHYHSKQWYPRPPPLSIEVYIYRITVHMLSVLHCLLLLGAWESRVSYPILLPLPPPPFFLTPFPSPLFSLSLSNDNTGEIMIFIKAMEGKEKREEHPESIGMVSWREKSPFAVSSCLWYGDPFYLSLFVSFFLASFTIRTGKCVCVNKEGRAGR